MSKPPAKPPKTSKPAKQPKPGKAPQLDPDGEPIDEVEASRAPLMDHLVELRSRLIRICICIFVFFAGTWFIAQPTLEVLLAPFAEAAKAHGHVDAHGVAQAVFQAPLELVFLKVHVAFLLALALGFPYMAYQLYAFVAPGLYKNERLAVLPVIFAIPILFVAGGAVVYYFVLPMMMDLAFQQEFTGPSASVQYLPKIKEYYDLALTLLTCTGLAFQLPVILTLLGRAGVVSSAGLRKGWKWAAFGAFLAVVLVTPPDPVSQVMLALPLYCLFEAGIVCVWLVERGRKRRDAAEEEAERREAEGAKPA